MKHDKVLVEDFYNMGFYPNFNPSSFYWFLRGVGVFVLLLGVITFLSEMSVGFPQ